MVTVAKPPSTFLPSDVMQFASFNYRGWSSTFKVRRACNHCCHLGLQLPCVTQRRPHDDWNHELCVGNTGTKFRRSVTGPEHISKPHLRTKTNAIVMLIPTISKLRIQRTCFNVLTQNSLAKIKKSLLVRTILPRCPYVFYYKLNKIKITFR